MASDTVKNSTAPLPPRRPRSPAEEMLPREEMRGFTDEEIQAMVMMQKHLKDDPQTPKMNRMLDEVIGVPPGFNADGEPPYDPDAVQPFVNQLFSNPKGRYNA